MSPQKLDALVEKQLWSTIDELSTYVALPNDAVNADDITQNIAWTEKHWQSVGFKLLSYKQIIYRWY
jgi:hypothetical protein